jgi:hypothetical protein
MRRPGEARLPVRDSLASGCHQHPVLNGDWILLRSCIAGSGRMISADERYSEGHCMPQRVVAACRWIDPPSFSAAAFYLSGILPEFGMSMALELIIDGYIRLGDRTALTELKAHREDLLARLSAQSVGCFDVSRSMGQMQEEIDQIEAGLARLNAQAAPLKDSDRSEQPLSVCGVIEG